MNRLKNCLFFLLIFSHSSVFAASEEKWSVSTFAGIHRPNLATFNNGLYKSPLIGNAPARVTRDGAPILTDFIIDAPLPEVGNGAKAGVEFQWRPNEKHALIFGGSGWEKTSISRVNGEMPIQNALRPVDFERRGKLSYTEYYMGWRYTVKNFKRMQLYSRVVMHEMFDVDYREDLAFFFPFFDTGASDDRKNDSFTRISVLEAQTASLLFTELGFGSEYYLTEWISIGAEVGWLLGIGKNKIGNVTERSSFQGQDNLGSDNLARPYATLPDGSLAYLVEDGANGNRYKPLKLDFNGWQATLRLSIHY